MVKHKRQGDRFTFSLGNDYRQLLNQIEEIERRSYTDILRVLLDRRAEELGLTPVRPSIPKIQALTALSMN